MSLGTTRDFLMKHKEDKNQTLKLPLTNGELLVMKGATQKKWLHSKMACTGNYYRYNVGTGPVYRWDDKKKEMELYEPVPDILNEEITVKEGTATTSTKNS
ncbi:hypothetical protein ABW20_dc0100141 [Dactylellina cionopaga]|nr:hypothetical protein ABW20_dc0100141 [Dactylellina cionopaga]